ncbi:MAG: phosphoribosylaminoimidazolesuccinocarboxamide synthase [Streptosporangiales bacterium]|nr:phosphoribosylaminoimidazolesuccinocarboxamide synthase [Streptosporangiales bacterium]
MELIHTGKVRDVYAEGDDLVLVASDRISVYDVVLPTPIPDKGKILTALSLWWFEQLADVFPNHVISGTDVPAEFAGRAVRCRRLDMVPFEFIARGHLAGLGLREYQTTGAISGVQLPAGLLEGSRLPEPIFTPTTKATAGHDEFVTADALVDELGADTTQALADATVEIYRRGAKLAADRGIVIADTKLEFGRAPDGSLVLADELLTPDSSRFWPADRWQPGQPQYAMDKQVARDWASGLDWDKTEPGPEIPDDVVAAIQDRYADVYGRITGERWTF